MSLSLGIIGLPNVGKSTLFNALLKRQQALAANYPFATIEPNIGVVDVPDERLGVLANIVKSEYQHSFKDRQVPEKIIPAVVKFYDIAGLVKGASKGEGLGNQFLGHIREVDAIIHVVRAFSDENVVRAGSTTPEDDKYVINTELALADLQSLEKRIGFFEPELRRNKTPENIKKMDLYKLLKSTLDGGDDPRNLDLSSEDKNLLKDVNLLSFKPQLVVYNIDEADLNKYSTQNTELSDKIYLSVKIESELSSLSESDAKEYLKQFGISESGLDLVIRTGYGLLGLQTFLTAGPKEVRAWTVKRGSLAPEAAGVIHTDFQRGFISAEIVSYSDLVACGGWKQSKERGLIRVEGKNYVMADGDVVEFRFNV